MAPTSLSTHMTELWASDYLKNAVTEAYEQKDRQVGEEILEQRQEQITTVPSVISKQIIHTRTQTNPQTDTDLHKNNQTDCFFESICKTVKIRLLAVPKELIDCQLTKIAVSFV